MSNVEAGDLAYITAATRYPENRYVVVEVIRRYEDGEILIGHHLPYTLEGTLSWVVRTCGRLLVVEHQGRQEYSSARDTALRPLRDGEGLDEMLRITGLPVRLPDELKEKA